MAEQKNDRLQFSRESLSDYLQTHLEGIQPIQDIIPYRGGHSNHTYLLKFSDRALVLRHPPPGVSILAGHNMSREYKVLQAINPVFAQTPAPLHFCADTGVIGVPFYLMQKVEGLILRKQMPEGMPPAADSYKEIVKAMTVTLSHLHDLDFRAAGLSDLGKPEGYIQRQITGWTKRYLAVLTDDPPEVRQLIGRLQAHTLPSVHPALIHNDYKLDNIVINPNDWTEIRALLDWEMATLGDRLMDLGTTLALWITPNDPPEVQQFALMPLEVSASCTRQQFAEHYFAATGLAYQPLVFHFACGLFKMGVVAQQLYYRYHSGKSQDDRFAYFRHTCRDLCQMALRALQLQRLDDLYPY